MVTAATAHRRMRERGGGVIVWEEGGRWGDCWEEDRAGNSPLFSGGHIAKLIGSFTAYFSSHVLLKTFFFFATSIIRFFYDASFLI